MQLITRKLPSFFIIGVQRAGTTSLASYLNQHPDLFSSWIKETDYFIGNDDFSRSHYSRFFVRRFYWSRHQQTYDSSVGYFYFRHVPWKIFQYNPDARFILIVRNPVERAISAVRMYKTFYQVSDKNSWYHLDNVYKNYFYKLPEASRKKIDDFYNKKVGWDNPSILMDEINSIKQYGMSNSEPGFIEKGIYYNQLNEYLKYFAMHQFLIKDTMELENNTERVLHEITEFLNVKSIDWGSMKLDLLNRSATRTPINDSNLKDIRAFYTSYNDLFFNKINKSFKW